MINEKILVDVVASIIVIALLSLAIIYIVKAKKRGDKCIGCPHAKKCGGSCGKRTDPSKDEK